MSWKVLITARTMNDVGAGALAKLRDAGCLLTSPEKPGPYSGDALLDQLEGHDAVLATVDKYSADVLQSPRASTLKIVSRWGVGFDAIDVPIATREGIVVAYTPGVLNETVADYTFALLLAAARRLETGIGWIRSGKWSAVWGRDIHGKTLGLLGCGRIGLAVARRAAGFDLRLLAYDPFPNEAAAKLGVRFVTLDELLAESDFLSLHCALTPENHGLIGEPQLRKMKPAAILINTARGALVNEGDLVRALEQGWIGGAALDAFATEPLPADHPLRSAPNVLLTPHQAAFGLETGERVSAMAAQAILDLMRGRRPIHVVNETVWDHPRLRAVMGNAASG